MSTTPPNFKGPEMEVSTPKKAALERTHEASNSFNVPYDESLMMENQFEESREESTGATIPPKEGEETNNFEESRVAEESSSSSSTASRRESTTDETDEERARREEEESIALAQQLMAEEAMAVSYHMSMDYLRNNRDQFSEEDLAALQAAMEDDEEEEEEVEGIADTSGESMSYELMLRLGERLGDVKSERWARVAQEKISCLPTIRFDPQTAHGKDDNDCDAKCLVCQFAYEKDEVLRRLPCGHCFHAECVDQWLQTKDHCPYCRTGIADS